MSLPGDFRIGIASGHEGCSCEGAEGCERPVYGRLCTEADSWGVEWLHLCKIHYLAAQCYERLAPEPLGDCDWCHAIDVVVSPMRDYEEGTHGPVYDVCDCCRKAKNKQAQEDYEATFDDDDEEEEDPVLNALNDLQYELSQSTILTRQDIRVLFDNKDVEHLRQIADECTEGEYSRLFPPKV